MGFIGALRRFIEKFVMVATVYEIVCTSVKDAPIDSDLDFQIVKASPE
jgi:hypothetical protein